MTAEVDNSLALVEAAVSGEGSGASPAANVEKPVKRKRNLAGMPDPDAEVIALSPKTLMATNRFVCEICNKGFQRDQNLQLHRRGHNLPWKLKQRTSQEIRKRVYVCPEPSCVHHDPSRALGDLTGIKKHFCRKHGEKKWKCDQCSKKYAVQSDWKAHLKICGTREYKCDCGTLFSRRDSFITHRAFCDALAVESAKGQPEDEPPQKKDEEPKPQSVESTPQSTSTASPPPPPAPLAPTPLTVVTPVAPVASSVLCIKNTPELPEVSELNNDPRPVLDNQPQLVAGLTGSCSGSCSSTHTGSTSSSVFASLFASSTASKSLQSQPLPQPQLQPQTTGYQDLMQTLVQPTQTPDLTLPPVVQEPISLCLSTSPGSSIFRTAGQDIRQYAPPPQPTMSATALLQKAAQMGASASGASLLRGYGLERDDTDGASIALGLGVGYDGRTGFEQLIMGTPSVYGPKHTLDFLGLGMAAGGGTTNGLSALMTSIGGSLDVPKAVSSFGLGGRGSSGEFTGKDMGTQ